MQASARRVGLKKLLDWILSVMALSLVPWRLVIGDKEHLQRLKTFENLL